MPSSTLNALKRHADKMTTDFPTAPSAYGLNGPSAAVTVEKSTHASHTKNLTAPLARIFGRHAFFFSLSLSIVLHVACLNFLSLSEPANPGSAITSHPIILSIVNPDTRTSIDDRTAIPSPKTTPALPANLSVSNFHRQSDAELFPRFNLEGLYYPRSTLTHPPQVIEDVDLSNLSSLPGIAPGRLTLELFIGKSGTVDRVEAESVEIPEQAMESLLDLLGKIRFTGGEIDGKPVKSRIRIEVLVTLPGHAPPSAQPPRQ